MTMIILETCGLWDIDYTSDNWELEFMTIFVTWHLIVTLDSIRNSCNVWIWYIFKLGEKATPVKNFVKNLISYCCRFRKNRQMLVHKEASKQRCGGNFPDLEIRHSILELTVFGQKLKFHVQVKFKFKSR